jgi:CubicO group peptidase (beta-lactamase class C family)
VSEAVGAMMCEASIPGLSLAVVSRDDVLISGGYGAADVPSGAPATPSTAYLWFSMTKIVTATAALRLADEGRLDLDAPAVEYVECMRAPGRLQPTVRQLLNHTAGLGNPLPIRWVHTADAEGPAPHEMLQGLMARRRPYRGPVGGRARYSNVGYLAVGEVVATAAGMPFEEYVGQSVLRPLGMDRTAFAPPVVGSAATGYVKAPRAADPVLRRMFPRGIAGDRQGCYLALNAFAVDGPAYGGLIGDVVDAGRFLRMHLNDGELDGQRVLTGETARVMRRLDQAGHPFDHGLGWFRRPTSSRDDWVEHFGAGAGFRNVMRLYPRRGIGIVVMSNSTRTYDFEPLFAMLAGAPCS